MKFGILIISTLIWQCFMFGNAAKSRYLEQTASKPPWSFEHRIKRAVLRNYDRTTRPVLNDSTKVDVNVAISLYHILDANEKEQTFTSLIAVRQRWSDEYIRWNPRDYGDIQTIRIPADKIWTPDLVISNFAGDHFSKHMLTNAIVSSDGGVLWLFPALVKTYCSLNVEHFPFDYQKCDISFISWTHSGVTLDLHYNDTFPNGIYYNSVHQEWAVDSISAERNVQYYACCVDPYPDVKFTIHMRRGSLFYIFTLMSPCALIYLVSFLGFFLPIESGEKVNLEITILLALVVFLLSVGETMPPTPDAIPLLGAYFGGTMLLVTIAVFMAVSVTNIYARKDGASPVPRWVVLLLCLSCEARGSYRSSQGQGQFHRPYTIDSTCKNLTRGNSYPSGVTSLRNTQDNCCRAREDCPLGSQEETEEDTDAEIRREEWKQLARCIDKIHFWLFIILSVIGHGWLFHRIA